MASLLERSVAAVLESVAIEDDLDADERRRRLSLPHQLIDELT